MPLGIGKDSTLLDGLSQDVEVSLVRGVDGEKVVDSPAQFLPEMSIPLVVTQIDLIDDLPYIDGRGDSTLFFEFFVVGFVHDDSVRVPIFDEVYQFLGDHQHSFFPFSFDIIGSFMMNC
jgi:hypothetical protein